MSEIVLTTLNARYAHAAFGLRYLLANLGALRERACIIEFDITQRTNDALEIILAQNPKIVGIGVYIWNAEQSLRLVADLKRVRPDVIVVLGGPEVSHEVDQQAICRLADYVITGEADLAFADLCQTLLAGTRPLMRVIPADLPQMERLVLPYDLYDARDVAHRVIYVEASRGCPFRCEFCLSSLEVPVRNVPLDAFLGQLQNLLARGARQFKFVDRTFNLNLNISRSILQFFHERYEPGMFLHFEMIPDRLTDALRDPIRKFPPGALQFEVGIQTFNEAVAARISRRQDNARLSDNLRFLREQTGVHVHADLIVGLPGETIESFAEGFDKLVALGPQEIQVGILKRLRGTPIVRHDAEWAMVYSPHAPYEILQNRTIDFATMQRLRRFSRFWDLVANSGNFVTTAPLIWAEGQSPFWGFLDWTDWAFARVGRQHAIALPRLAELLFQYLATQRGLDPQRVAQAIAHDYQRVNRPDLPDFLRPFVPAPERAARKRKVTRSLPRRQARHASE
ncbi:MAG TPA: DUF4080 domain-containing protein [Tepidisphaeraceae bacterium]